MAKVIVVYESNCGNTKRVAETIVEGINEIKKIEAVLKEPKHVEPTEVLDYDVVLIGSPNHIGGPTRCARARVVSRYDGWQNLVLL